MERQRQHQDQQQCRRQHRHRRVTSIFLMLFTLSSTIEVSYGWTTSSSSNNNAAASTTKAPSSTSISKTAAFYKTSTTDEDDFQTSVSPLPPSPIITSNIRKRGRMHNGIYSIRDIHSKIKSKKKQSYYPNINRDEDSIIGSQLPWIDYNNENKNKNEKYENNVYLSHWEWQLSYFQQHLTNFRINDDTTEAQQQHEHAQQQEKTTNYTDLMYTHTTDEQQKDQRIYTVSYQSDEYRDIRITYMNFPGSQFFRCMCYPNSIHVPILGMAYMQFGSNVSSGSNGNGGSNGSNSITKNMAFMDYQPILLPTSSSLSTSDNNDNKYRSELLRIQSEIPSMNTPISHKHFDSEEERKYFTDCPLICKWDNDNDSEFHHQELVRAQHDYIKTHIKLTKEDRMMTHKNNIDNNNSNDDNLLKLHSDFDTFVSAKEPAGKLLCHAFGTKIGNQLVHRILFPLSRNKI